MTARPAMPHGTPAPRSERRAAAAAAAFTYSPQYEQAAKIRDTDPAAYDRVDRTTKLGLGYYELAKTAAAAAGIDTTTNPNEK